MSPFCTNSTTPDAGKASSIAPFKVELVAQGAGDCVWTVDKDLSLPGPDYVNISIHARLPVVSAAEPEAEPAEHVTLLTYDQRIPVGKTYTFGRETILKALGLNHLTANLCVQIRRTAPKPPAITQPPDLPCDFAAAPDPNTARFFPIGCEPCEGLPVRTPPVCEPTSGVPVAAGGCIRPRFFDGMFLTSEDLETQLRFFRIKNQLQNRAMGHGVVWGFDVRMVGRKVHVGPGYGVDCCGHDLTVTCDYEVDGARLLRDPAVCALPYQGELCLPLLLEYVECPESPRPVHAGSCNGTAAACEMSRLRETVRFRLVPPRDQAPRSPLADAVEELLRAWPAFGGETEPVNLVPWLLSVKLGDDEKEITPSTTQNVSISFDVPGDAPMTMAFGMRADNGWIFEKVAVLAEPISGPDPAVSVQTSAVSGGAGLVKFKRGIPALQQTPDHGEILTIDWRAAGARDLIGQTKIVIRTTQKETTFTAPLLDTAANRTELFLGPAAGGTPTQGLTIRVRPPMGGEEVAGTITAVSADGGFTVLLDAPLNIGQIAGPITVVFVSGTGARVHVLSQTTTVWSPQQAEALPCCGPLCCEGEQPDPRLHFLVLSFALQYGRLAQEVAARKKGVLPGSSSDLALRAGRLMNEIVRRFRATSAEQILRLELVIAAVYEAWCSNAIYPGPACLQQPDGVVIGCAHIRSGEICSVDPLDGRRWVIHPPLLEHWAAQFGLGPVDQSVMRLFSRLCCISHLEGFGDIFGHFVAVGSKFVASRRAARDYQSQLRIVRELECMDFKCLVSHMEESFCVRPVVPALDPESPPADLSIRDAVNKYTVRLARAEQTTPRLQPAVESTTEAVLRAIPLEGIIPEDVAKAVSQPLADAGITTVSDLIAVSVQDVDEVILQGEHLREFDDAVIETERVIEEVVTIVTSVINEARDKKILYASKDLDTPAVRKAVATSLIKRLDKAKIPVNKDALRRLLRVKGRGEVDG